MPRHPAETKSFYVFYFWPQKLSYHHSVIFSVHWKDTALIIFEEKLSNNAAIPQTISSCNWVWIHWPLLNPSAAEFFSILFFKRVASLRLPWFFRTSNLEVSLICYNHEDRNKSWVKKWYLHVKFSAICGW